MTDKFSSWILCCISITLNVNTQDFNSTWLGYGKAIASSNTAQISRIDAYWTVPNIPSSSTSNCNYSIFFGIESNKQENFIKLVNSFNSNDTNSWSIYTEYDQYKPHKDDKSESHLVKTGDIIYGTIYHNGVDIPPSYTQYISDVNNNWSVSTIVPIQSRNNQLFYNVAYFVFDSNGCTLCDEYPSDDQVLFYNITIWWNDVVKQPQWSTSYVQNICHNRANDINSSSISITWQNSDRIKGVNWRHVN